MTRKGESGKDRILDAAETLIMQRGFAGTSIDDILKGAGLTKGAFFHHFTGKGELARELVERHAQKDITFFTDLARQAEEKSDDPLEQVFLFMEGFEYYVSKLGDQPPGCIYAVYTYESMQFEPAIRDLVADTLHQWTAIYVRKFHEVLERYEPAMPVTARELGEMAVSAIEGGFVLARAYGDGRLTARQSEYFRKYLTLLFAGNAKKAKPKRAGAKAFA
jgi:TetR/AcrR family transcriptional regulator, transcriptional repressor for nem operon